MRGFPPFQLLLVVLLFVAGGIPVYQLTKETPAPKQSQQAATSTSDASTTAAFLKIRWAHPPQSLTLSLDSVTLYQWTAGDSSPVEKDVMIPASTDGWEIAVNGQWPETTPSTALSISLSPEDKEEQELTRWSLNGTVDDILSYTWP
jgi:hypothetical protein